MAYNAHFYLASSNDEIFTGTHSNDIIIRTDDPTQQIFIGPFPLGVASNCVLQIANSNISIGADIIPLSNQVFNIGSFSNMFNVVNTNNIQFANGNLNVNSNGQLVYYSSSTNSQGIVQCNITNFSTSLCNIFGFSNNIGIANSNPVFQLDVNGDINFTGLLRHGGQQYINSQWITGSSSNYLYISQCNISISDSSNYQSEKLYVDGDLKVSSNIYTLGSISIGGSNPSEQLDILNNTKVGSNLYVLNELSVGGSNPSEQLDVFKNTKLRGQLYVYSNVCIGGRSNPSEKLDVDGNIKVKNNAYVGCNLGVNNSNPLYTVDINGDINIVGRVFKNGQEYFLQTTACNAWLTYSNAISNSNFYFNMGYIACGSSNPSEIIDVFGNTKVRDNLYVLSNVCIGGRSNPSEMVEVDGNIKVNSNVYIGCNLGVNTSNPQYTVDVNGDINIVGNIFKNGLLQTSACNTWLTYSNSSNIYFDAGFIGCGYSNPSEQLDVVNNVKIGCNLYVLSNVCIGYGSNPTAALEVGGQVVLHSDLNVMGNYLQNGVLFTSGGGGGGTSQWTGPFSNVYANSNINYMGRVGICNNTPLAALHVGGDVRIDGSLAFTNTLSFGGIKIRPSTLPGTQNVTTFMPVAGLSNQALGVQLYTDQLYVSISQATNELARFTSSNTVINTSNLSVNNITVTKIKISGGNAADFSALNSFAFSNETNGIDIFTYSNSPANYVKFSACNFTMFTVDGTGNGTFTGSVHATNGIFTGTLTTSNLSTSGSKQFDIIHPDPEKTNMRLRHSCVESASRGDTIFSTKVVTREFDEQFNIELPNYWQFLNENPRVIISYESDDEYSQCCAKIDSNCIRGRCQVPGIYTLLVIGTRKDKDAYTFFDNVGGVEYYV